MFFLISANAIASSETTLLSNEYLVVKEEAIIWNAIKNNNGERLNSSCKGTGSSICIFGKFILGKSDAKTFLKDIKGGKRQISKAVGSDELIARYYYQTGDVNPFGNSGYVFSVLDLIYSLTTLYPSESVAALVNWYKYSEGEYAEYAKEKLIWIFQGRLNNNNRQQLFKYYKNELSEIDEIIGDRPQLN